MDSIATMRTITLSVPELVYEEFREHARKTERKTAELIREAMELYRQERIQRLTSLKDRQPTSVGGPIRALVSKDDLLGRMLDDSRD